MIKKSSLAAAASICLSVFTLSAKAAPVYVGTYTDMYLKQNTFPSGLTEEMVFLDSATGVNTVIGHISSQTDLREVHFTSTTDMLTASNGFATITADDGLINELTITAPGYWFEDLIFSVNLTPNSNDDLSITATDKSGGTDTYSGWAGESDWVNGNNRILALSHTGNLMKSVTITSQIGMESVGGLDQLKQTEISGVTAVPVPAAVWLFGSGLLGLIGVARRRR